MSLTMTENKMSNIPPVPAGTHIARCMEVVDLGTQLSTQYNKLYQKVRLTWEIPGETHVFDEARGPEPRRISRDFTVSYADSGSFAPFLIGWRGRNFTAEERKDFHLGKLAGAGCMLNVIHADRENGSGGIMAQVASASPMPKGIPCPPLSGPPVIYDIADGKNQVYEAFPDWLKAKIAGCEEWKTRPATKPAAVAPAARQPGDDTEIPF